MWLDFLKIVGTALASAIALLLLTKLTGNKQISQMSMFDYVVGITIGSIAAEMATELEAPHHSLLAMVIYGVLAFLISVGTSKSMRLRRFFTGRPILLMSDGKIYRNALKKARLDLSDFLTLCRAAGYFDPATISIAIMECNGTVSFLPTAAQRAAQPADFGIHPKQEPLLCNVILDGVLMRANLRAAGFEETWLRGQLRERGYTAYRQILLATCDTAGSLTIYPMDVRVPRKSDPFA